MPLKKKSAPKKEVAPLPPLLEEDEDDNITVIESEYEEESGEEGGEEGEEEAGMERVVREDRRKEDVDRGSREEVEGSVGAGASDVPAGFDAFVQAMTAMMRRVEPKRTRVEKTDKFALSPREAIRDIPSWRG